MPNEFDHELFKRALNDELRKSQPFVEIVDDDLFACLRVTLGQVSPGWQLTEFLPYLVLEEFQPGDERLTAILMSSTWLARYAHETFTKEPTHA